MITDFFCLLLKDTTGRICGFNKTVSHATQLERIWFYCKRHFLSSWRGNINWPSRSWDLPPLDFFFLWNYVKDHVYEDKPSTLEHLETNIRQVMAEIPPNIRQKVVENYLNGINACNTSRVGHLNDVVFHIIRSNFPKEKWNIMEKNILYVFYLRLLLKPRNG